MDVVVASFRRPVVLARCLRALAAQQVPAARIIVVIRVGDESTAKIVGEIRTWLPAVEIVYVDEPGVVAAMTAGVAASSSALVAFTDDDAEPSIDWLGRICAHFRDPSVGAVGGRDLVVSDPAQSPAPVGTYSRLGRPQGNHHRGVGPPRDALVLKGVNMAFRSTALMLPAAGILRGSGAQVNFEVLSCGAAAAAGWRLVYDPAVLVVHRPALRHDNDQRGRPDVRATFDAAYNTTVADVWGGLTRQHPERLLYPLLVGGRDRPGVLRSLVALVRGERPVIKRAIPAITGILYALVRLSVPSRRPRVVSAGGLRDA